MCLPEFITRQTRTANKRHVCDECRGWIDRGTHYEVVEGKWDGLFNRFKTCPGCLEARNFLHQQSGTTQSTFTALYEELYELTTGYLRGTQKARGYRHLIGMKWRQDARILYEPLRRTTQ